MTKDVYDIRKKARIMIVLDDGEEELGTSVSDPATDITGLEDNISDWDTKYRDETQNIGLRHRISYWDLKHRTTTQNIGQGLKNRFKTKYRTGTQDIELGHKMSDWGANNGSWSQHVRLGHKKILDRDTK